MPSGRFVLKDWSIVPLKITKGQVWAAAPNRDADEIVFEIVGAMVLEGSKYWIAAKHASKMDLLSKLEVNLIVVDEDGYSVPSNLTFAPQLEWRLTRRLRQPAKYKPLLVR